MKHLFNSIESAINTIIDASQKHSYATEIGDYKTANKNYDIIQKAVIYLRANDGVYKLRELLTHSQVSVRVAAASFLLKHFEQEAIGVLEEIASKSIPHQSFNAQMVLQEWRNGNLAL
jgi:hypothetical protein